jgi:hypothetical protein
MVVYQALYGEQGLWVRPAAMFTQNVQRDGATVPRFALEQAQPTALPDPSALESP